jgi:RAD51-like protein 2
MSSILTPEIIQLGPQRHLTTFQLNPQLKTKLLQAGFSVLKDLGGVRPSELARELNVSPKEITELFRTIVNDLRKYNKNEDDGSVFISETKEKCFLVANESLERELIVGESALGRMEKESSQLSIITFSQEIDSMLGSGVPLGKVTEFSGVPGIGKTQIGIQLAVDVQIPLEYYGVGGHAIYIDTEGSFVVDRAVEVATGLSNHLHGLEDSGQASGPIPTTDQLLENIYYYRIHDYIEQIALINILPSFLKEKKNIKLIVIDSISFLFRQKFDDYQIRNRLLNGMSNSLMEMASLYNVAIVVMNQVTTKIHSDGSSSLEPSLGQSWSHLVTNRVMLYWKNGTRYAALIKSPTQENRTVPYMITGDGVRDILNEQEGEGIEQQ